MKPEDFKKLVKIAVQEELKRQLPQLVPQILAEALTGKPKSVTRVPSVSAPKTQSAPQIPSKPKEVKKYSNNPLLNQILNETVVKIKPENSPYVGYSERPTSTYTSDFNVTEEVAEESVDYSELNELVAPSEPVVADIQPATEEQAKVLSKINRDFRSIMKAVDAKKKGGVNPFGGGLEFDS
jgi:hypothetical protein